MLGDLQQRITGRAEVEMQITEGEEIDDYICVSMV